MRKVNGIVLIFIGIMHCGINLADPGNLGLEDVLSEIAEAGYIDAAASSAAPRIWGYYWFLMTGLSLLVLGILSTWVEWSLGHALPAVFGWALLAFSLVAVAFDVKKGFWLVLAVAISIIVASRREPRARRQD